MSDIESKDTPTGKSWLDLENERAVLRVERDEARHYAEALKRDLAAKGCFVALLPWEGEK